MRTMLLTLALIMVAAPGMAQLDPGDLFVAFDAAGTQMSVNPPAFTTTNVAYVMSYGVDLAGYEFAISITSPDIIIFSATEQTSPGSINVGTPPLEWIVGIGLCKPGPGVLPLVQLTYGYFVPAITDVLICLGPSDPASLNPPATAYLDCSNSILPFGAPPGYVGLYPPGCGVLYPTADCCVAAESRTWGSVKSEF